NNLPCNPDTRFTVVDFSQPVSVLRRTDDHSMPALPLLKSRFKLNTVFRYYDHKEETIEGKTLLPTEADALLSAHLKIGVVFQHYNDDPGKFMPPDAGSKDAARALDLADLNRQPYGSAIYFGIDGPEDHLPKLIAEYHLNHGQPMSASR